MLIQGHSTVIKTATFTLSAILSKVGKPTDSNCSFNFTKFFRARFHP